MLTQEQKNHLQTIDGKEYIITGKGKGRNKILVYTLDDGTKLTINMLADILRCDPSCARARLNTSLNPERIYKPLQNVQGRQRQTNDAAHLMNSRDWYTDPMIKLLMKNI
jgi:hypothetical protein